MKNTNVKLSENEMELVTNSAFILTKNEIINKVYDLFGALSENYKKQTEKAAIEIPAEVLKISPKIYKGEHYLQLPYVMLDYPRFFVKPDIFAIRSFFWWGNYFSISLQLAGKYKQLYVQKIMQSAEKHELNEWFVFNGSDVWQHRFMEEENISFDKLANNIALKEEIFIKPFIKIMKKLPLLQWDSAYNFFTASYAEILKILNG